MNTHVRKLNAILIGLVAAAGMGQVYAGDLPGTMLDKTGVALIKGNVYVWGHRTWAQQGNGVTNVPATAPPAKVESLQNIQRVSGGLYHLIALTDEGQVSGWGRGGYGENGCGTYYANVPCGVLSDVVQIDSGAYFSIALRADGDVYAWGHNAYGQLGNGSTTTNATAGPAKVNLGGEKVRLIGAAYEGAFAVTEQGHVWAWGDNEASGLGFQGSAYGVARPTTVPVRVANLEPYARQITYIGGGNGWGQALLDDGRVIGWGVRTGLGVGQHSTTLSSPQVVVVMDQVEKLFSRYVGSVALTKDGYVHTWGQCGCTELPMIYGYYPTLRYQYDRTDKIVDIGGGKEHLFFTTESGKLIGVGLNDQNKLNLGQATGIIDWPGSTVAL
ncbi:MAG: hypothetical protein LBV45_00960 [Xanthomonadaceae bacterium]|jgi:alpha-tubulin suppressor-like RCC1 family protein|nr:hypothetical protein [Xanthomonadaceae bacterium]